MPSGGADVVNDQHPAPHACRHPRLAEMQALFGMGGSTHETWLKSGDKSGVELARHGFAQSKGQAIRTPRMPARDWNDDAERAMAMKFSGDAGQLAPGCGDERIR